MCERLRFQPDCSPLRETGRHFAGLYCHMPLPILILIRAATAGARMLSHSLTRQSLAHAERPGLRTRLATHCVVSCYDQTQRSIEHLHRLIGGGGVDGWDVAPLFLLLIGGGVAVSLDDIRFAVESN